MVRCSLRARGSSWFNGLIKPEHGSMQPLIPAVPENESTYDDHSILAEVDGKVKTRLLSMWNNVKYGWTVKIKTNFSKESPVWLLGLCYQKKSEDSLERASEAGVLDMETGGNASQEVSSGNLEEGIDGFKPDFISRLWLTYRREFPILTGPSTSVYTTDCGWGCMLRSGQMMMAQALVCHILGREWRWKPDQKSIEDAKHRMIIRWFGDQPGSRSPLSIHTLVKHGEDSGKRAGDWYGPASVAHILKQAVNDAALSHKEFSELAVYVAQDCAVYLDDVEAACKAPDGSWRSLILLVPLRLGADKLNSSYSGCLTGLLTLKDCIGIIGGRPRHSLYFIGYQEDKLIHLDPHYCQETVDVSNEYFSLTSFHCTSPRKMLLAKMDPSCCVGFYLRDKQSFDGFVEKVEPLILPQHDTVNYPLFLFCNGSGDAIRQCVEAEEGSPMPSSPSEEVDILADDSHHECEEFELL
ncbi:cysteine protease ATG4C isoform X2 [Orussus abietinus]|uniref:cysteine protease ATG4C isoform X2 n=1 Tax=Orussus abietinus TaxID=222816 RepID=UPI000C715E80|nr:cysteine protease ATG4C isoform X2 [Orussus abietinus]